MSDAPITARDYHDIVDVGDPRVDPAGERVAFVRTVPDGDDEYEATVYAVDADGESDPGQFTVAEGVDSEPRFSPSGDRLAFVSTRGEDDRPQLWVLPTDGGEARRVTDVAGGVSAVAWAPDGERIAFLQRSTREDREEGRDLAAPGDYEPEPPDPRVIDRTVYRSMEEYFDGKRSHVYLADLDGGVERVTGGDRDFLAPAWGDADTLYYAAAPEDVPDPDDTVEVEIYAHDLVDDDREAVTRARGWIQHLAATDDGRVAYPHVPGERVSLSATELRVYDRRDGTEYEPTADLDRTVGGWRGEARPQWGPDDEYLYFRTPDEGSVLLRRVPWDGDDTEVVAGEGTTLGSAHVGTDGEVAYTCSETDHPGDVFLLTGGEHRRLTRVNADYLDARAVADPEEVWFEGPGGPVQGWLLLPPDGVDPATGSGGSGYPLAVEVHGGPHATWTASGGMFHEFQTLAARGYAVFWCNPRGSTGYGERFQAAIDRDWGDPTLADVEAGIDEVLDRPAVGEELFLTGGSFGGYTTAWAVGHTDRFEAAVAQRGVYDLAGFYGSTDGAYRLVEDDFDALPWADPEFLHEHSPTAHAPAVETPTLLVHSDRDYRTPACTAEAFYRALCKHGVDARMVRYPREGHELSRSGEPAHVVDRIERIVRWFDGYCSSRSAPPALDRPRNEGLSAGDRAGPGGEESQDGDDG